MQKSIGCRCILTHFWKGPHLPLPLKARLPQGSRRESFAGRPCVPSSLTGKRPRGAIPGDPGQWIHWTVPAFCWNQTPSACPLLLRATVRVSREGPEPNSPRGYASPTCSANSGTRLARRAGCEGVLGGLPGAFAGAIAVRRVASGAGRGPHGYSACAACDLPSDARAHVRAL